MTPPIKKLCGIFLTLAFNTACVADDHAPITGQASVIDGDTIEIHGNRIRLHGIDAPEANQTCSADGQDYRCGQQSALFLDRLIDGAAIHCEVKDYDRYGRTVAECFARQVNVNAEMVRKGWAVAYHQYSDDYADLEKSAEENKIGIWAGDFQKPWDFRRSPTEDEIDESGGCLIKGNINAEGRKIYHVPGGRYYGQTIIDTNDGERWFCTESDAQSAGWMKSSL